MSTVADRILAFAHTLQPDVAIALLRTLREFGFGYKESAVTADLVQGRIDDAATLIAGPLVAAIAIVPLRQAMRTALMRSASYFFRDTPKVIPEGRVTGIIRFNALDPAVTRAAAAFESPMLDTLATDVRAGVKKLLKEQLAAGVNPRTIARELRPLVGLSENQVGYLANYRAELGALSRASLERKLTDGRIDRTVAAAIRHGKPLTAAQVDRAVDAYAKNLKASTAETLSRTTSINALKEGQRLAWKQAAAQGKIDSGDLIDTWYTKMDGRERPAHHAMHLKTKRFDEPWIVPGIGPQDYPGQSEYQCRCVVFTRPRIRGASAA